MSRNILENSNSIIDQIYYLLWLQQDVPLKDNKFQVQIPDTIIIKDNVITNWFFTSKQGIVLQKRSF